MDPGGGGSFLEPGFSESPLGDGDSLVGVDANNREMIFPVYLRDATKAALNDLARRLRLAMDAPGCRVQFRDAGEGEITYWDLVFGRFEPEYDFWRATHNRLAGTLRLDV